MAHLLTTDEFDYTIYHEPSSNGVHTVNPDHYRDIRLSAVPKLYTIHRHRKLAKSDPKYGASLAAVEAEFSHSRDMIPTNLPMFSNLDRTSPLVKYGNGIGAILKQLRQMGNVIHPCDPEPAPSRPKVSSSMQLHTRSKTDKRKTSIKNHSMPDAISSLSLQISRDIINSLQKRENGVVTGLEHLNARLTVWHKEICLLDDGYPDVLTDKERDVLVDLTTVLVGRLYSWRKQDLDCALHLAKSAQKTIHHVKARYPNSVMERDLLSANLLTKQIQQMKPFQCVWKGL